MKTTKPAWCDRCKCSAGHGNTDYAIKEYLREIERTVRRVSWLLVVIAVVVWAHFLAVLLP